MHLFSPAISVIFIKILISPEMETHNIQFLTQNELHFNVIIKLMSEASSTINIATSHARNFKVNLGLKDSLFLVDYLKYYSRKGVQIRILVTPNTMKSKLVTGILNTNNIDIKACARNHMKIIVIDSEKAYVGTANLTSAGLGCRSENVRNFELGFITESHSIVQSLIKIFNDVWHAEYCTSCRYFKNKKIMCSI